MKFSIVTACRNAAPYIAETLESVLRQTVFSSGKCELEYLVLDGASTDGTLEVLARYQKHGINVISERDNGFYAALAKGLQKATGDYVAYLNAGDFLLPGGLSIAADCFALSGVDWITGYASGCNDRSQIDRSFLPYRFRRNLLQCGAYGTVLPFMQQESTLWRRRLHETVDFRVLEKLRFAGDSYLWKCFSAVCDVYIVRGLIGVFRVHKGQISEQMERYRSELRSCSRPMTLLDWLQCAVDRPLWSAPVRVKARMNRSTMIGYDANSDAWRVSGSA